MGGRECESGSVTGAAVGGAAIYGMVFAMSAVLMEKSVAGTALTIAGMCAVSAIFLSRVQGSPLFHEESLALLPVRSVRKYVSLTAGSDDPFHLFMNTP